MPIFNFEITAYYREHKDHYIYSRENPSVFQANTALGKGRAAIFEKWLPKWTGERVNGCLGRTGEEIG